MPEITMREASELPEDNTPEQSEQINNPTETQPEETVVETEEVQPEAPKAEETPEETFAKSFDPKTLPPELQNGYKLMQADYTRKMQEFSSSKKQIEEWQKYLPVLNKVMTDREMYDYVMGVKPIAPSSPTPPVEDEYPDDPKAYAEMIRKQSVEEAMKLWEAKEQERIKQDEASRDYAEAEKVDPRLNTDADFQRVILGLVSVNPDFNAQKLSAVEATKQAIAYYDTHIETAVKARQAELVAKAKEKKFVVKEGNDSPGKTFSDNSKPISMREAYKQVQAEL